MTPEELLCTYLCFLCKKKVRVYDWVPACVLCPRCTKEVDEMEACMEEKS